MEFPDWLRLKTAKRIAKDAKRKIFPPPRAHSHLRYSGPYPTWHQAVEASVGYDSPYVLSKVRAAIVEVLEGRKAYERDGTTFDKLPKKYTLREKISGIIRPSDTIVDFGGGLGGTYINNRDVLYNRFRCFFVIEQESFCTAGSELAQAYRLPITFMHTIEELPQSTTDIVILSGVLHCIDSWQEIAQKVNSLQPRHILLDRHPLVNGDTRILVQENDGYYETKVSYPVRMFNSREFLEPFTYYRVIDTWPSDFDPSEYRGFHLTPS
jgi:putative methyltransferase (TIGR04325 family)